MKREAKATGMWVIYLISGIIFIYALVCLKDAYDGYYVDDDELEHAITWIGYSIGMDIWSVFAYFIYVAGVGKGYYEARYFWLVFLFPILGIPMLAIAPDLIMHEKLDSLRQMTNAPNQQNAQPQPQPQPYVQQPYVQQTYSQPQPTNTPQYAPPAPNNNVRQTPNTYVAAPDLSEKKSDPQSVENAVKMCAKFALSFTIDMGMVRYVKKIAKEPDVGEAFQPLLGLEPSEMCTRLEELAK